MECTSEMPGRKRTGVKSVVTFAAALVLIGDLCAGDVFSQDSAQQNDAATSVESGGVATPGGVVPGAEAGKPLAVQEHDDGDVDIAIVKLERSPGDMLTLRWKYLNKSSEEKVVYQTDASQGQFALARAAYLIDNANKKKYFVVVDAESTPVAAKNGSYGKVSVDAGKSISSWAKFPAPPPSVQKVTVYLPGAPPFEDVPING